MTIQIPQHFVDQYSANVQHLLQRKGGKYRMCVEEDTHYGEQAVVVNQFGSVEMEEVTERFQPMGRTDINLQRVWLTPRSFDIPPMMIDTFDKLKLEMTDADSQLARAGAYAVKRQIDNVVANAFFTDMQIGQRGTSTQAFDTTNHRVDAAVGSSGDTGLNVEKIIRGLRIMEELEIDIEEEGPVYLAITPKQRENLMNQVKVVSADYFNVKGNPVYVDGKLKSWGGVELVCTTKVPSNSSYRLNPMWIKSGMHFGLWKDMQVMVDPRPDIRGRPIQTYFTMSMNATRREAGRVLMIENLES